MRKPSSIANIKQPRKPRGCDARITITPDIVMIEYTYGPDLILTRDNKKAQELLINISLPKCH